MEPIDDVIWESRLANDDVLSSYREDVGPFFYCISQPGVPFVDEMHHLGFQFRRWILLIGGCR